MRIGIRAEGGAKIGMGHIVRCLALARAFRQDNHDVIFISTDPLGRARIAEEEFESFSVSGSSTLAELKDIQQIVESKILDCLIIDSYQVDRDYFIDLKNIAKLLCYIDDLNRFVHPADVLINGNFGAEIMGYRRYNPEQVMLLGVKYNLIREEFQNISPVNVKPDIHNILITMGAADPVNFTPRLIQAIREDQYLNRINLQVIVGGSNPYKEELIQLGRQYHDIYLHQNVKHMSELMLKADLALSAGGSTLYELLACGVPVMGFIIAENQQLIVNQLAAEGYIKSLDWYHQVDPVKFCQQLKEFPFSQRREMAFKGRRLVDGRGSFRVRDAIVTTFVNKYG